MQGQPRPALRFASPRGDAIGRTLFDQNGPRLLAFRFSKPFKRYAWWTCSKDEGGSLDGYLMPAGFEAVGGDATSPGVYNINGRPYMVRGFGGLAAVLRGGGGLPAARVSGLAVLHAQAGLGVGREGAAGAAQIEPPLNRRRPSKPTSQCQTLSARPKTRRQVIMKRPSTSQLVIVFRGTGSAEDWMQSGSPHAQGPWGPAWPGADPPRYQRAAHRTCNPTTNSGLSHAAINPP